MWALSRSQRAQALAPSSEMGEAKADFMPPKLATDVPAMTERLVSFGRRTAALLAFRRESMA